MHAYGEINRMELLIENKSEVYGNGLKENLTLNDFSVLLKYNR